MAARAFLATIVLWLGSFAGAAAADVTPADLAGWWLAVDGVQPVFWKTAKVIPAEELLRLDASGRAETRLMSFNPVDPGMCVMHGACSDAPLLQHTGFTVADDLLTFEPPVADDQVHLLTKVDALRRLVATSAPAWLMRLSAGGKILFLTQPNGSATRAFARVDPVGLGRIRAGYLQTGHAIIDEWRCFVAHATAGDTAFLPLQNGEMPPPPWFPDYLIAASYFAAVETAYDKPPPDVTNNVFKTWSAAPLETLLIEPFPDTGFPRTMAESNTLFLKYAYLSARADGLDDRAARARIADKAKGEDIVLAIGEDALATLSRAKGPDFAPLLSCN